MTIRYKTFLGLSLIILGFIGLALAVWDYLTGGELPVTLITQSIIVVVGFLIMKRPYFTVSDDKIEIYALLGPASRSYEFGNKSQLQYENGRIFSNVDGVKKKIPVSRFMAERSQWDEFTQSLTKSAA